MQLIRLNIHLCHEKIRSPGMAVAIMTMSIRIVLVSLSLSKSEIMERAKSIAGVAWPHMMYLIMDMGLPAGLMYIGAIFCHARNSKTKATPEM